MRALLAIALSTVFMLSSAPAAPSQTLTKTQAAEFAIMARAGAPTAVSLAAGVAIFDTVTKTVRVLSPTANGFMCSLLPDGTNAPICADIHAWQWFVDAFAGKPAPSNAVPGVAYMAQGGWHFETPDGATVMAPGANTKQVEEPPHWMLLWPISAATSGLPTKPSQGGVYVMFDGTPYAHLMVYQDPASWLP